MARLPHPALLALLAAYLILATSLSLFNPPFESPDEIYHLGYIKYLVEQRALPQLVHGELSEYHQGPLFYVLGAFATLGTPLGDYDALATRGNPFRGYRFWEPGYDNKNVFLHGPWDAAPYHDTTLALHLVRGLSVLYGLAMVSGTYLLARRAFGFTPPVAVGAAAFVAFNPVFLLITSSIHNDALTMPIGAALLTLSMAQLHSGASPRREALLGLILGLDWLTKISTLFIAPPIALALLFAARRTPTPWRTLVRGGVLVFGGALVVSGWMFARNILIYGEPTGVQQDLLVWTMWTPADALRSFVPELPFIWTTFWGRFGHGEVPMPDWTFWVYGALCAPAVFGVARAFSLRPAQRPALLVLLAATASLIVAMGGYYLNSPDGHAARYTFPALSATACLLGAGWAELAGTRARWATLGIVAVLAPLATWAVFGLVPDVYAPPPAAPEPLPATGTTFGALATVLDANVAYPPEGLHPGATLDVTLTWRALQRTPQDYAVYVHLIDEAGVIIAQRDTYPGLGRYPSTAWTPGTTWRDTYRVTIPDGAYTPNTFTVHFGLYAYPDGTRVPVGAIAPQAQPDGTTPYTLAAPTNALWPNATRINFDGRIALLGYTLTPRHARAGDVLTLTLVWEGLAPNLAPYTVFAHVIGPRDAVYANGDGVPRAGTAPTPLWPVGVPLTDTHTLRLAPDTPPGQYDVELGWYHTETFERLFILEAGGVRAETRRLLSPILVAP